MKISVENLGVLKQAEFELGDLTLICGHNNTGKTYATYALFGFLWHCGHLLEVAVSDQTIEDLLREGVTRVDIQTHAKHADKIISRGCEAYTRQLPRHFASRADRFKNSMFRLSLENGSIPAVIPRSFQRTIRSATDDDLVTLSKAKGEKDLIVSLVMDKPHRTLPSEMLREIISDGIIHFLFDNVLPRPFIASSERTGAAIFRKELNFARNRLLEEMSRADRDFDPRDFLFKSYQDYPAPVKINVDFIRQLENIAKDDSFLADEHRSILDDFAQVLGGEYIAGSNDTVYFKPVRSQTRLTMDESSSAVRSLLDIGFYLRHVAQPGDLLMVDEPELNLHPQNQRRMARLFARLVNLGIRVFVTTHSDYIVKELNILMMLNQNKPHLEQVAVESGYRPEELMDVNKVRAYVAETALISLKHRKKKSRVLTLVPASIDPEMGIDAKSFDRTIHEMNQVHDAIVWGR